MSPFPGLELPQLWVPHSGGHNGGGGTGSAADFNTSQPVGPTGHTWTLSSQADDFNYASIADPAFYAKWWPNRSGPDGSGGWNVDGGFNPPATESNCYSASQVQFGVVPSAVTFVTASNSTGQQGTYPNMSGTICSIPGYNGWTTNTYVEAYMRLHSGAQLWPAFWGVVLGTYPPEFDGFEFFGGNQGYINYHPIGGGQTGPTSYGPTTLLDTWHTWGFERASTSDPVRIFIDGLFVGNGPIITDSLDYFIIFDLACAAGATPAYGPLMDIGWVRPWYR